MNALEGLPPEALHRFSRELGAERILWAGRPDVRSVFIKSLPMLLFAIPWTAFSLAWEALSLAAFFDTGVGKVSGPGGIFTYIFPIFGLPFVVVGLGMMAMPWWAARKARRTIYALTEERLVTAILGRAITIKSIAPERVFEIARRQRADGSGTLTFSLGQYRDSDGDMVEKKEIWPGVPDAKGLEEQLRAVMAARHKAG